MQLIRCTAKLRKEMGLTNKDLFEGEAPQDGLGQWHAKLVYIFRRKCVVFINDRTLLNFVQPDVRRAQIRELDELFRSYLRPTLQDQGLNPEQIDTIMSAYDKIDYAKSNDRSVLGSLNDIAFQYESQFDRFGGLHIADIRHIIRRVNRTPMGAQDYLSPDRAIQQYAEQHL